MKSPHKGFTPPDFSGQSKILFLNEGNPVALLLTNRSGKRRTAKMTFAEAVAAFNWCRASGAMMVYCPALPRDQN
jgi:hypothetical protein